MQSAGHAVHVPRLPVEAGRPPNWIREDPAEEYAEP